jgi:hypothetical protein
MFESIMQPQAADTATAGVDWLGNAVKTILGTVKMPIDVGADALRQASATLFGGNLRDPGKYTSAAYEDLNRTSNAVVRPVAGALSALRRAGLRDVGADPWGGAGDASAPEGAVDDYAAGGRGGAFVGSPAPMPADGASPPAGRDIGVGGPAPSRSLPRNGARSPVAGSGEDVGAFSRAGATRTSAFPLSSGGGGGPLKLMGAEAAGAAPAEAPDLAGQYRKRLEGIPAPRPDLTPEQKNKLQQDFFLRLLANSSQRGANLLGSVANAGEGASASAESLRQGNLARGTEQQKIAAEEAYREANLGDKTFDNRERARHERKVEDLKQQENDILKQYREGQIDAKAAELETKRIQTEMATLRLQFQKTDPLERSIQTILKYVHGVNPEQASPQQRIAAAHMALTKDRGKNEDELIDTAWQQATARAASSGMPAPSRSQIAAHYRYGDTISRSNADYKKFLAEKAGGDRDKADALIKTQLGLKVVD